MNVWLEGPTGPPIAVNGSCSLGRSRSNQVVLDDKKISRRHAIIHAQGEGEYWLVDFGSTNGTMVNGRRVVQPTRLQNGDQILIGDHALTFRKAAPTPTPDASTETSFVTAQSIKTVTCWLLVVDIENSTVFSRTCPPDQLPVLLGRWFSGCKEIVDTCGGQINKFLGDGFFAYWIEQPASAAQIADALQKLGELQKVGQPSFRWVLHHGPVCVGGSTSMGEESLIGPEVNFVFRMEKLAGSNNLHVMLSDKASERLTLPQPLEKAGPYEVSAGLRAPTCFIPLNDLAGEKRSQGILGGQTHPGGVFFKPDNGLAKLHFFAGNDIG